MHVLLAFCSTLFAPFPSFLFTTMAWSIETRERLPSHDAENDNDKTITKAITLFHRTHAREEFLIERNSATLP